MGRVVNEQRIALQYDQQINQGLVRSAAARASGLEYEEFDERLQVGGAWGWRVLCACMHANMTHLMSGHGAWQQAGSLRPAEASSTKQGNGGKGRREGALVPASLSLCPTRLLLEACLVLFRIPLPPASTPHPPTHASGPVAQRLLTLMPFLQDRLLRMSPKLLAALAADPGLIAARLVELRALLPAADVAAVAGGRPSLLLPPEWERVPAAAAALARRYSEPEVARLVAAEPLLLAEDVEAVLAELQR